MVSSARAILSELSCPEGAAGPFVAAFDDCRAAGLEAARGPDLLGFFDIFGFPDRAPITGLKVGRKRPK
jgi:hypothetical protein